jgi:arylsulfatase A-like enzyme
VNHRPCVAVLFAVAIATCVAFTANASKKPNIIIIVGDDLGYADLGCQGAKDVKTPNIDSIARNGVRFTDGYVSCPVCSPTRAGLMTGKYQQRFGHELNPPPPAKIGDIGLSLKEHTLAEKLKNAGYATGMFGKWHLGMLTQYNPTHRGFDEYFGFLGGMHDYLDWAGDIHNPVVSGTNRISGNDYLTEEFTRHAVSFIEKHKKEPFFIYLPYNAVHAPLEVIADYKKRFPDMPEGKRKTYLAMLAALDDGVGQVLKKLRDTGLEENTLVIFFSDNGGPTKQTTSRNDPLRGNKGQVWEGGIHTPAMMQWKGTIPAGQTYTNPVIQLDYHMTALVVGGARSDTFKNLDGVNLLPFVTGKNTGAPHDYLYWRFGRQWAIRGGNYKLTHHDNGAPQLYDLSKDIGEKHDISSEKPEIAKKLQSTWDQWNKQLKPPAWTHDGKTKEDE